MADPLLPGWCQHCRIECRDTLGSEIWPGRADLADKTVWVCGACGARVGSHPNGKPLGTAANAELRRARELLHGRIDPIWALAFRLPTYEAARNEADPRERQKKLAIIKRTARSRVYRFVADRMGLTKDQMHVAMFDIEQCRAAWVAIRDVTYADVRTWAQANKEPAK